jgi:two-component system nitrate/nitrite response regulator NarL
VKDSAMTDIPYKRALLVEDQNLVALGMKTLIVQIAPMMEFDQAHDFDSAIGKLQERSFDLLFLDVDLGRASRSGLDVLQWIQEQELPIHTVMLSSNDDRGTVLKCIDAGASGFISKGSQDGEEVFRAAISTILSGQVFLPSTALGKGGFSPSVSQPPVSVKVESLGVSGRLAETLSYICLGMSNKAVARKMDVKEGTIKEYASDLYAKFGVRGRAELIVEMARRGVVVPAAPREYKR